MALTRQARCPKCGHGLFYRNPDPRKPEGVFAGYRYVPVICQKCGYDGNYGLEVGLPRLLVPAGEASKSMFYPVGHVPASKRPKSHSPVGSARDVLLPSTRRELERVEPSSPVVAFPDGGALSMFCRVAGLLEAIPKWLKGV